VSLARADPSHAFTRQRIALWDEYGGSIESGWIRYIFDNFGFKYDVVYPPQLDAGNLRSQYDVIILPRGAVPDSLNNPSDTPRSLHDVPAEWLARMGGFTTEKTLPAIRAFVEQGGRVITIGSANNLAKHLTLPIDIPSFKREEFYVPGSVLEIKVDTTLDVAAGMTTRTFTLFDNSPFFRLKPDASKQGIKVIASYEKNPLRSGWAWGQEKLEGAAAALEVPYRSGIIYMFGPEITFRSQSHGTYKFLFNALFAR
jgi:hypothetical protein